MNIIRLLLIISIGLIAPNSFGQLSFKGVDNILKNFDEDKYFQLIVDGLYAQYYDNNIKPPCVKELVISRNSENKGLNLLIIPQFWIKYDTISNEVIDLHLDTINPINRAVIFNKNRYSGSLLFVEEQNKYYDSLFFKLDSIFFCPCLRKTSGYTDLRCGKYIYRENKNYKKSLKRLLNKKPLIILKDPKFEYVWFYVDKNRNLNAFTYDLKEYSLNSFLKIKDMDKYVIRTPILKDFR